ncbi:hypothetical protein EDB86DRAFT_2829962 [Lactarius hatsudake]|nr:hypothetical protein EDB86DRAFT_2829962 [Lactarius hatsudake]
MTPQAQVETSRRWVISRFSNEAMHKFLESEGVLVTKDYFPDDADEGRVKAYEEHGLLGPDPSTPRICLKQMFKGKWNKEVVEILVTNFILAVKKGTYKAIQHTWPQMNKDRVLVIIQLIYGNLAIT